MGTPPVRTHAQDRAPDEPPPGLRQALLTEPAGLDGRVRCRQCQRLCSLPPGKIGYCRTKVNLDGTVYDGIYGVVAAAAADPIEKKPVYHYRPGTRVFSVGSPGCNFRCRFCQNWELAYANPCQQGRWPAPNLAPAALVEAALAQSCQGVAWTYSEPSIWLTYTLECAQLAKAAGLYTVYVTNGYATREHLDLIAPYLDVYRVDIKSTGDRFYRALAHTRPKDLLAVTARARGQWGLHVECVTNVVPGWNDSDVELRQTAAWIAANLGGLTPWHLTRFFPAAQLLETPATPVATLLRGRRLGQAEGLRYVYLGNVADIAGDTKCPGCGLVLIRRAGYRVQVIGTIRGGQCGRCGASVNITL